VPKLKLNGNVGVDAAKVDAVEGFSTYDGPVPPAGLYPASVISIKVGESKESKKAMLTVYTKIDAPKNDKKKRHEYNGYLMSDFLVIPDDKNYEHYGLQVGQINRFLDALSGEDMEVRRKFWSGNAVTSADGKKLESVGTVKIKGGVKVIVNTKKDSYKRKEKDSETGKEELVTVDTLRINDYLMAPKSSAVEEAPAEEGASEDDFEDTEVEYEDAEEGEESDDSSFVDDSDEADADDEDVESDSDAGDEADEDSEPGDSDEDPADDDGAEDADGSDESTDAEDEGDIEGVASEVSVDTDEGEVPAKAAPRKRRSAF
jgi:hypothetical protein